MLNIAYTVSPFLTQQLTKIESLRRSIILYPLSPEKELLFQFHGTISRIGYAFYYHGENFSAEDIQHALQNQLTSGAKTKQNQNTAKIIRYKKGLDYIKREWLVSAKTIDSKTLIKLYSFAFTGKLRVPEKQLQEMLDYLQATGTDNPVIQAAIAKLQFTALEGFSEDNELFGTLCSYLFLYKAGLDCRSLLVLEHIYQQKKNYQQYFETAREKQHITSWIEYFTKSISEQLEETYQNIKKDILILSNISVDLNERQKAILNLLDDPSVSITNRTVQKAFGISQITASRDLAKLTTVGLLFGHGKGRSVRYTRV